MRYEIYERGYLRSYASSLKAGAWHGCESLDEALKLRDEYQDDCLDYFVYDTETGDVWDKGEKACTIERS